MPTTTRAKRTVRKSHSARTGNAHGIHIGLNAVDPHHYAGWGGPLVACEQDAHDMAAISSAEGVERTVLLTKQATRKAVLDALDRAAKQVTSGGFLLLTYSGHGGQVPDVTGEETDHYDETWCLYDGQLIDDEIYLALGRFKEGVRILVLSDSCHSGTVVRAAFNGPVLNAQGSPGRAKMLPPDIARKTYEEHKRFYDDLERRINTAAGHRPIAKPQVSVARAAADPRLAKVASRFKAGVILISGCQDNQTSLDGDHNGAFTEQLLRVWQHGAFKGSYAVFHARIKAGMPASQTPNLYTLGKVKTFLEQHPFQVAARRAVGAGAT